MPRLISRDERCVIAHVTQCHCKWERGSTEEAHHWNTEKCPKCGEEGQPVLRLNGELRCPTCDEIAGFENRGFKVTVTGSLEIEHSPLQDVCGRCHQIRAVHRFDIGCKFRLPYRCNRETACLGCEDCLGGGVLYIAKPAENRESVLGLISDFGEKPAFMSADVKLGIIQEGLKGDFLIRKTILGLEDGDIAASRPNGVPQKVTSLPCLHGLGGTCHNCLGTWKPAP